MFEQDDIVGALGTVALNIGEPDFHLRLFDLIGAMLPHEMGWIVRYGDESDPDILYTKDVAPSMVDYYLNARPRASDPYLCSWRSNGAPRVESMDVALPLAIERDFYASDFMKKFSFKDELAIFLPCAGPWCFSMFLERREKRFTSAELSRINRFFPALLSFHQAHVRSSFSGLIGAVDGSRTIEDSAACIIDRFGAVVFETQKWRDLATRPSVVLGLPELSSCDEVHERAANFSQPLRIVTLDGLNPVAPGGVILYAVDDRQPLDEESRAEDIMSRLTPRERDIVALTLDGHSTGAIAQRLGIAKGSIKNYRLRVYRKFSVTSERALIAMMMPFSTQLKAKLGNSRRQDA